jgi:hypothetical protein
MRSGSGSPRASAAHAVAALCRDPEEAGHAGLEAADQVAVGHEGAQAGPGARGAADGERGRLLDAVHCDGDVHLLGLHVLRLDRVGIGRRAQQHAGVGLDVPAFVGAEHHRPVRHALAFGRSEDEGGAPARLDAQRRHAGHAGDGVDPCAGGVENHGRFVD